MAFLRSQKVRDVLLQALFVAVLLIIVIGGWRNGAAVMQAQNMISGFSFLEKSAGWNLNFSLLPVSASDPYWWFFVNGIINTLFLGVVALALATLIGGLVGIARTASNDLLNLLGRLYVDFFRNIPLILQVFFWYSLVTHLPGPRDAVMAGPLTLSNRGIYAPMPNVAGGWLAVAALILLLTLILLLWLPRTRRIQRPREARRPLVWICLVAGLVLAAAALMIGRLPDLPFLDVPEMRGLNIRGGMRVSPEFTALMVAIGIYGGAYIGEIVRGGFKAVGRGQVEAASSLGLRPWHVFSRIRLPLALRAMLPILANQYIWLIKATTLGIAVGFTDFFMIVAVTINQSGQTLEAILILMVGFLIINLTLAAIFNRINKAIALKGNQLRS